MALTPANRPPIAAMETTYAGCRYRSRVEARWRVFFDAAGIESHYEPEGYVLPAGPYLPDFWLPGLQMFFEVKGGEPSALEALKCAQLASATERDVLLAAGPPEMVANLIWFTPRDGQSPERFLLARDRIADFGFWLLDVPDGAASRWIGPAKVMDGIRGGPMLSGALEDAYAAARSARFERGDGRQRQPTIPETDPARTMEPA